MKNRKNRWKIDASIFWSIFDRFPPDSVRKWSQHGPNLDPKMEPRWSKNPFQNRSFFWCLLESMFGWILLDFGRKNGAKLAPKSDQKLISTLKAKNQLNTSRLDFSWFQGVEVGLKIDQKSIKKSSPRWKASWHRFFIDFGGFWEPSWEAKSSHDRSKMASKKRWKKEAKKSEKKRVMLRAQPSAEPGSQLRLAPGKPYNRGRKT